MNFFHAAATSLAERGGQFMMSEMRFGDNVLVERAVVNQDLRPSFHDGLDLFAAVGSQADSEVESHQGRGRNQAPHERVIPAIHRVLHRVGPNQQENQIEGSKLPDLTLARDSQND